MTTTRQRWEPPSELLVLAAVDRAERHRAMGGRGVTLSEIADHLGMRWGSVTSRRLRPIMRRLTDDLGWLEEHRRHGIDVCTVTADGAEQLAEAFPEGVDDALPESPQHRDWREARAHATRRIEALRADVATYLDELGALLRAAEPPTSDEWLAFADPVRCAIRRVGFATYCLSEWDEPEDARADVDETAGSAWSRVGRRHYRVWDRQDRRRDS